MNEQLRHGPLRMVLMIAAGVVAAFLATSVLFWALGAIIHLIPFVLRLAVFVGLVGGVWWLVAGRRRPSRLP
jgi:hypothetical protein